MNSIRRNGIVLITQRRGVLIVVPAALQSNTRVTTALTNRLCQHRFQQQRLVGHNAVYAKVYHSQHFLAGVNGPHLYRHVHGVRGCHQCGSDDGNGVVAGDLVADLACVRRNLGSDMLGHRRGIRRFPEMR